MKNDPKLDFLVAEKIMGWRWFQVGNIAVLVPSWQAEQWVEHRLYKPLSSPGDLRVEHRDGSVYFFDSSQTNFARMPEPPKFSSDVDAAWRVLEDLVRRGYSYTIRNEKAKVKVFFDTHAHGVNYTHTSAATAICKAALRAMRRET